jgi:hypothetical protein
MHKKSSGATAGNNWELVRERPRPFFGTSNKEDARAALVLAIQHPVDTNVSD